RFVMAHYGNPWIVDATEVAVKNPNVFIDISGLAVGRFEPEWFCSRYSSYLEYIKMWMTYLSDYKKIMYGSDWPLVNLESYLSVIKRLIPEDEYENVFFNNALRVFPKISRLL
ncbi:MAG: amidohydrolase family protein, partial [Victivallaceae bacterium]